jgi:hypothetical protein
MENNIHKVDFSYSYFISFLKINEDIKKIINGLNTEETNVITSYNKENEVLHKNFTDYAKEWLINIISKTSNYKNFELTSIWMQKYKENYFHNIHIHGVEQNNYSFIWYIDVDESSAPTYFYNVMYPYIDLQAYAEKPINGKFILFPSYIPHEVKPGKNNVRTIISGNLKLY